VVVLIRVITPSNTRANTMKTTAIYLRCSSKSQTTESQKPDLERWAAAQDTPIVWYSDTFTGKTMDRPGWNKLYEAIQRGEVARVVVWRLDRLGRTARGLTALFSELQERGIGLVSLKDGLDLSTPAGRLLAHVLASVSEYETEVRAERVRAGQERARSKGKRWGGRKTGTRVKVTTEKERAVKQMKGDGWKVAAIARTTGLSRQTIYTILG
jgi:DNA invertase Pin-like site-specific DNA recombinase